MKTETNMKIAIADVRVPKRRARPLGDVAALAESIKAVGLLQPIVVTDKGVLVAGLHRLRACESLGWTEIEATKRSLDSLGAELAEIDENLCRNDLTVLERSDHFARRKQIYEALHPETKARSSERQSARRKGQPDERISPGFASATARATGVSPRTVQHEVQISERIPEDVKDAIRGTPAADSKTELLALAKLTPERQRAVARKLNANEGSTVRDAVREANNVERVEKLAEIAKGNAPLPVGRTAERYPVIYADPPWRYEHVETESRAIENHYPTMDLDAICALKVSALATPDAVLFLWATSPKLAEAMRVVEAWGFSYRTCMVWVKDKIGMGYYARQRHELLLIATRGAPPVPLPTNRPDSVISGVRAEHSAKPGAFAEAIERMYPGLPRVELFCRSPRPGWDVWGNQSEAA